MLCGAVSADEPVYDIDIASMNAAQALNRFAEQTGTIMLFSYDLANARRTSAVRGRYTLLEGLELLLKGTGLSGGLSDKRVVNISTSGNVERPGEEPTMLKEKASFRNRVAAFFTSMLAASSALGQDTAQSLEEIVVTAQKRSERLLDVPISISAVTNEYLQRAAINTVTDLEKIVPNFSYDTAFGSNQDSRMTIRGIVGSARNAGFESGVSVYVDGVYAGRPVAQNMNLVNVERVEVLRGPQGTLFGKNTIAGAVNIITRKPGDTLEGKVSANIGNFEKRNFNGYLSGPIAGDRLYAGVSAFSNNRDGYVKNLFNGEMLGTENSYGGDLSLRYLGEQLEANMRFDYLKDDYDGVYAESLNGTSNVPGGVVYSPGIRTINLDSTPFEMREVYGAALTLDYELGEHALTSISSYRNSNSRNGGDNDNAPLDYLDVLGWHEDLSFVSQELRLASPVGGKFDYLVGLYLFQQDLTSEVPFNAGAAHPQAGLATVFGEVETQSGALFAQGSYHLTDELTLTGGLRYTLERRELQEYRGAGTGFNGVFAFANQTDDREDSDVSPMVSLGYALTDSFNVYVKAARGFKSGGWNIDFLSRPDHTPPPRNVIDFEPEVATTYELGLKGEFFARRLMLNVAAFRTDYKDLQVQSRILDPLTNLFTSVFNNAASSTIDGAELDWNARLSTGFSLRGGVGYTDAKFDSFAAATLVNGVPVSFDGKRLPDAPEWNGSLMLEYERPLVADKMLSVSLDYFYKSDFYTDAANSPTLLVDSYEVLGGRIGIAADAFEIFLWGKNLADKDYLLTKQTGAVLRGTWSMPRTYGVQMSYKF